MTVSDRNIFSTDPTRPAASETASFKLPESFNGGTLVASRHGGAVKGAPVPTPVFSPPKATRLEGYNNIVQFSGAKTPAARPPGVAAVPGQTFFAQGAFVFSAPAGDDTIAGRKYVGFAPGLSALSLLGASMQAQGFPEGNKIIWGEGLPKEHQVTADEARRFLETEGSVEDSRSARSLQRAEAALRGKLLGIMNELARQQKPATPAPVTQKPVAPAQNPVPVAANPPRETKPVPATQQPEAPLPPSVRPKASQLPPPPKFDEPLMANPFPKGPSPQEIATKDAGLQRKAADAANAPVKSWGDAQTELNGLNQRLSALGPSPEANKANGLLADLSRLIVRGERLEQGLKASRAGERPDVVVGSTVLSPKEAARSLQQIRDEVANKLGSLRKEIDGLTKSSATRQSSDITTNPFATPERTGPIVIPGAPKASGEQPEDDMYTAYADVSPAKSTSQRSVTQKSDGTVAKDVPDAGGGGTVPPTKPPKGGGGNGGVPDPDENPEEWNDYIASFRQNLNEVLKSQGKNLDSRAMDRVISALRAMRSNSTYTKQEFMSKGLEAASSVRQSNYIAGVPMNKVTTTVVAGGGLAVPVMGVFATNNPQIFRNITDKLYGPNPINAEVPSLNEPANPIAAGGKLTGNHGQDQFVVGQPPQAKSDLADSKNFQAEVKRIEDWGLIQTERMLKVVIDNTNSQKVLITTGSLAQMADHVTRRTRWRDLDTPPLELGQLGLSSSAQSTITFTQSKIDSAVNIALGKLRDGRTQAIGNLVNKINADVAQTRATIRPDTGGFTFIPSQDPSADMNRIDINIREAQRYQKELATGQDQVQVALDKLRPYLSGLEAGGAALEGADALKRSQAELQALLATIQRQQKSMGDTLLTLAQNRQSLQIAMKNLSLSQQNTGLNEDNAIRNQIGRDEAAAANQRTLGKSAMDRWNTPSAPEAQPIEGAPGFRKPFSGRGNLLEKLDDAVRPFQRSANDVPASVWLRVLDQMEPNWIYAVMEPTSKPLTEEEVTKRKAEILNQAGPADKALLDAVLGTMRNR